jgi:hypothetical protein
MPKTKTVAVIIKHPGRDWEGDVRVDLKEVPEDEPAHVTRGNAMDKMLGPFQVLYITEKVSAPVSSPSIETQDRMIKAIRAVTEKAIAEGPEACRRLLIDAGIMRDNLDEEDMTIGHYIFDRGKETETFVRNDNFGKPVADRILPTPPPSIQEAPAVEEKPSFPLNVSDEVFKEASAAAYLSPEVVYNEGTSSAYIQGFCVAHARFSQPLVEKTEPLPYAFPFSPLHTPDPCKTYNACDYAKAEAGDNQKPISDLEKWTIDQLQSLISSKDSEISRLKDGIERQNLAILGHLGRRGELEDQIVDRDTQIELLRQSGASLRPGASVAKIIQWVYENHITKFNGLWIRNSEGLAMTGEEIAKVCLTEIDGVDPDKLLKDRLKASGVALLVWGEKNHLRRTVLGAWEISRLGDFVHCRDAAEVYDQFLIDEQNNLHKPIDQQ